MGSYDLREVIRRWGSGSITAEQAIGQILQLLQVQAGRLGSLEQQLAQRGPGREAERSAARSTEPASPSGQDEDTESNPANNCLDSGTAPAM